MTASAPSPSRLGSCSTTKKLRDRRNVFSYCLKRPVLLIMIRDFPNGETSSLSPVPPVCPDGVAPARSWERSASAADGRDGVLPRVEFGDRSAVGLAMTFQSRQQPDVILAAAYLREIRFDLYLFAFVEIR
jgi:hypothetical protein